MVFDADNAPEFGSLYAVKIGSGSIKDVNEYGGEDEADAEYLDSITNTACGSTCLFGNGSIYRCEPSGWKKFGEVTESTASAAGTNSLHLSPIGIDRNTLYGDDTADLNFEPDLPEEIAADEGEESTLEAQKSAATSSTADEVSV